MKDNLNTLSSLFNKFVMTRDEYKQAELSTEIKNKIQIIKTENLENIDKNWQDLIYWIDDSYEQLCQSKLYDEPELFITENGKIHEDVKGFDNPNNIGKIGGDPIAVFVHLSSKIEEFLESQLIF